MNLVPKRYEYEIGVRWTEGHSGEIYGEGLKAVDVACPPEFGGDPGYWSPEHLFVASVGLCIMTTFLSIAKRRRIGLVSYESRAKGLLTAVGKEFRFARIDLVPEIVIDREDDVIKVRESLHRAEKICPVSLSMVTELNVLPEITVRES